MNDHGPRRARLGQLVKLLYPLLVVADQALDGDARDIGVGADKSGAIADQPGGADHRKHDHHDGKHAPERQFAPHPAAIDDQIGIERHAQVPLLVQRNLRSRFRGDVQPTPYSFSSSSSLSLSLRFKAVPRMSPSVAPELDEPYCAIASFSSATSSALMDTVTL